MSQDILGLLPYCQSETQRQAVEAIAKHGSNSKAAKALGKNKRSIEKNLQTIRRYAENYGYHPETGLTDGTSTGMRWAKTSTLKDYRDDPTTDKMLEWVIRQPEYEQMEAAIKASIEAMKEEIPKAPKIAVPKNTSKNLLNQYTITDYHIGALAWHEEAGEDWDTDIAEELLIKWFGAAIKSSPDAEIGVFAELGDFEHWDGLDAVTPTSKHVLDADTRLQRLIRVSIKVNRQIIDMLLKKHKTVHVIFAEGNHNPASSAWRRELFTALYEKSPRVVIDRSADIYYCLVHGDVSLFYHHGHRRPPRSVDHVFASKFREQFGSTRFSYAHMGHLHHDKVIESNLMTVEQHRTLAAKDSYASRGGYMSDRSAKVITYDKRYGEVGRITLTPEMVMK